MYRGMKVDHSANGPDQSMAGLWDLKIVSMRSGQVVVLCSGHMAEYDSSLYFIGCTYPGEQQLLDKISPKSSVSVGNM